MYPHIENLPFQELDKTPYYEQKALHKSEEYRYV